MDRTSDAFEPFSLLANDSSNDTLCYGQAMKAHDSEDFKKAMVKEVNDLCEVNVFDIMTLEEKPQDRKLIKFM